MGEVCASLLLKVDTNPSSFARAGAPPHALPGYHLAHLVLDNSAIFENDFQMEPCPRKAIDSLAQGLLRPHLPSFHQQAPGGSLNSLWSPPSSTWMTINVDAGFRPNWMEAIGGVSLKSKLFPMGLICPGGLG
ncbi:hypothetical protein Nepgr_011470 [Nepenthes gracilis]|uniref:Uncharacterized protein n=1 Tax=Nepenthes gracilis TaxID=150966 RepID=A0AAD3XMC3_NEPGR|nr:hypothetical protein Nepgr_011470 [Nepenthes gracilis]